MIFIALMPNRNSNNFYFVAVNDENKEVLIKEKELPKFVERWSENFSCEEYSFHLPEEMSGIYHFLEETQIRGFEFLLKKQLTNSEISDYFLD